MQDILLSPHVYIVIKKKYSIISIKCYYLPLINIKSNKQLKHELLLVKNVLPLKSCSSVVFMMIIQQLKSLVNKNCNISCAICRVRKWRLPRWRCTTTSSTVSARTCTSFSPCRPSETRSETVSACFPR